MATFLLPTSSPTDFFFLPSYHLGSHDPLLSDTISLCLPLFYCQCLRHHWRLHLPKAPSSLTDWDSVPSLFHHPFGPSSPLPLPPPFLYPSRKYFRFWSCSPPPQLLLSLHSMLGDVNNFPGFTYLCWRTFYKITGKPHRQNRERLNNIPDYFIHVQIKETEQLNARHAPRKFLVVVLQFFL